MRGTRPGAAVLAAALLATACGAPLRATPVEPRAAWLLESTPIRVGDVASLDRVIVTPPGWTVSPFEPPAAPDGFWLLDAESLPTERLASRWMHRTRLRIRAREVGHFEWPAATTEIEAPGGEKRQLPVDALALEVVSVLAEAPDPLTPFGVRPLPETAGRSLVAAAAAGALGSLGALAIGLLVVRRRRARAAVPREPQAGEPADSRASARLTRAREALAGNPELAADAISAALRQFVAERFGIAAPARTSEELAAMPAPFSLATRWAGLVTLLRALDSERFAPQAEAAPCAQRVAQLLDAAEAFVAESLPLAAPR